MKNLVALLFVAALFTSCSSAKIYSDYDKTVDFTKYKTLEYWGWSDGTDQLVPVFDQKRIEDAFGNEFKNRGVMPVAKGKGDIIVSLHIVTEQKQQTTATTSTVGGYGGYGYGGYYGYGPGYGYGMGYTTTNVSTYNYTVGTLLISVFDSQEKRLIWEASAEGTINEDPKTREKTIPLVVAKMMSKYPVPPMKK